MMHPRYTGRQRAPASHREQTATHSAGQDGSPDRERTATLSEPGCRGDRELAATSTAAMAASVHAQRS
jgi:hypothetical protein